MAIYFFAMYLLGGVLGPIATGRLSDYFAHRVAAAEGMETPSEGHKALGLHEAMYLIPILTHFWSGPLRGIANGEGGLSATGTTRFGDRAT